MRLAFLRCLCLLACLACPAWGHADIWTIRADYWCPYNCAPEDAQPGYMIEILQRAARSNGHVLDYKLMPWPRALEQARLGTITGVVGMVASNRSGLVISDKMGVDSTCVFVPKGSGLRYQKATDLRRFERVGIVEGYGYPDEFIRWKDANPTKVRPLAGNNTLEMQAKKLASGRIDAFIENSNVVRFAERSVAELGLAMNAGCMSDDTLYFGYSAKHPRARDIKAQVDREVATMRRNGELQRLLAKYQVAPW